MAFNFLIVDDSTTTRIMIKRVLHMTELPIGEIFEAEHGEAGLALMRQHWIDLVLADLNMPIMDGMTMINVMQQDEKLKKLPIVVVSSEGSAMVLEALEAKGVRQAVRKPFNPAQLKQVLERTLASYA
jgi:two-component system chemotaxis response regulator CheY